MILLTAVAFTLANVNVLAEIATPKDLRKLAETQLPQLCDELRTFLQQTTETKSGHIKSSLGVTELTTALHYVFNTPEDILIWDVGHQAYVHKILTGRKDQFHTNRAFKGLSGFTNRTESEYDPFGAGHSSTALAALSGFAQAASLQNKRRKHIAVVGDGALTGGMHFEAMNFVGGQQQDVLLIVNRNKRSIDENVGALHNTNRYEDLAKAFNFTFSGAIDGHHLPALLAKLKETKESKGPQLLVVDTIYGNGYTGLSESYNPSGFQKTVGDTLVTLAEADDRIVVVSPAMLSGAGLISFQKTFPERCFDVGIAEQHAVTFSAGLAAQGYTVFCHLYSTFAQRAYDQIIHDVALQKLPVIFLLDRAGLVGADGATHHGAFDLSFLNAIPNMTITAPADENSLEQLLQMASTHTGGPMSIRYPKGGATISLNQGIKHGEGRWLKKHGKKLVVSLGALPKQITEEIQNNAYAHYDWVFLKPFNVAIAKELTQQYHEIITVEAGSKAGGLGDTWASFITQQGLQTELKQVHLPDAFVPHGTNEELYNSIGFKLE